MAKTKTKKEKIVDLKPEKVNEEQLKKIQNLISAANKAQADIGNIEIQKHNILHQIAAIQDRIVLFREEMNKAYGTDNVDIKTGVINYPNPAPQNNPTENGKADKKD